MRGSPLACSTALSKHLARGAPADNLVGEPRGERELERKGLAAGGQTQLSKFRQGEPEGSVCRRRERSFGGRGSPSCCSGDRAEPDLAAPQHPARRSRAATTATTSAGTARLPLPAVASPQAGQRSRPLTMIRLIAPFKLDRHQMLLCQARASVRNGDLIGRESEEAAPTMIAATTTRTVGHGARRRASRDNPAGPPKPRQARLPTHRW